MLLSSWKTSGHLLTRPSNSLWNSGQYDLDYTLSLAERFSAAGYDIYLDFHFSDTWADPANQAIPSGWSTTSVSTLASQLEAYVTSTLNSFHAAGVDPVIVSLGNEISDGFLFPLGSLDDSDFTNFATLWKAARNGVSAAVSAGMADPEVIIHLNNGWDESLQTWFYEGLFASGTVSESDVDGMGVSFYPFYGTDATFDNLLTSLNALVSAYDKPVYVAETNWPESCPGVDLSEDIAVSAAGQTTWVEDVVSTLGDVSGGQGAGIFYWEPAWLNNAGLGSSCEDAILFDVDWSNWPATKATARSSVNMFE